MRGGTKMWFTKLIKQFFFWIDKIVYNFISSVYDLMITIARTSVLTQADIADMADRIYKLLAIFMIFKVTLSLITYVVNPDDFSDKTKGISKLGTNIVISMTMLILTPYIFNYAYQFQTIILEDNSLATLIFGDQEIDRDGDGKSDSPFFNTAGDDMAFITMSAFISPNLSLGELHECAVLKDTDTLRFNELCKEKLLALTNENFSEMTVNNYVAGMENKSLGLLFRQDLVLATAEVDEEVEFVMDYKFIISTVVGVVIILLLISFCMDVAVRSLKLAFLQLIAPIPIISYVDPKSGKDGLFKKWYQMCFKTFLSLFVRLLALYFAVYIISKVADGKLVDVVNGSYQTSALVAIFIIIGALMFAKQLPKILESLGIKIDGGFTLNPLRKMEKEALGGKILKKPNDALGKWAKGGFGAKTLKRKIGSGIDAARNDKGFWNGFNGYKGDFGKWRDKRKQELRPYSYENAKKAREGKENIKMKDKMYNEGEALYNMYDKNGKTIKDAFKNPVYKESFQRVNDQKAQMFDWEHEVEHAKARLASVRSNPNATAKQIKDAEDAVSTAMTQYGKSKAQYELSKSKHDDLKKVYREDAKLEDSHDFYTKNSGKSAKEYSSGVGAPTIEPNVGAEVASEMNDIQGTGVATPADVHERSSSSNTVDSSTAPTASSTPTVPTAPAAPTAPTSPTAPTAPTAPASTAPTAPTSAPATTETRVDPQEEANADRQRIKREVEEKIEEFKKRIKNLQETLNARKEVYETRIKSLEDSLEKFKEQKRNAPDTASKEAIDRDIAETEERLSLEKAKKMEIEKTYNEQIEYCKKQIEILENGV